MAITTSDSDQENGLLSDINTTPLIDVMLVLLIMLIITIPPQTHSVRLEMPRTSAPAPVPPPVVKIDVDFDGTILWNGTMVPDRAGLEERLRAAAAETPQPEIHLAPNRLARYDAVAMVLAEAQRLGLQRLGIVGAEQYMRDSP